MDMQDVYFPSDRSSLDDNAKRCREKIINQLGNEIHSRIGESGSIRHHYTDGILQGLTLTVTNPILLESLIDESDRMLSQLH